MAAWTGGFPLSLPDWFSNLVIRSNICRRQEEEQVSVARYKGDFFSLFKQNSGVSGSSSISIRKREASSSCPWIRASCKQVFPSSFWSFNNNLAKFFLNSVLSGRFRMETKLGSSYPALARIWSGVSPFEFFWKEDRVRSDLLAAPSYYYSR